MLGSRNFARNKPVGQGHGSEASSSRLGRLSLGAKMGVMFKSFGNKLPLAMGALC